jgi:hypothetical protein
MLAIAERRTRSKAERFYCPFRDGRVFFHRCPALRTGLLLSLSPSGTSPEHTIRFAAGSCGYFSLCCAYGQPPGGLLDTPYRLPINLSTRFSEFFCLFVQTGNQRFVAGYSSFCCVFAYLFGDLH